jgi:hypothetical protein
MSNQREKLAVDEALHTQELKDKFVAQHRLGHNCVERDDEQALGPSRGHHNVVPQTAQSPGQVDAEDEENVKAR